MSPTCFLNIALAFMTGNADFLLQKYKDKLIEGYDVGKAPKIIKRRI